MELKDRIKAARKHAHLSQVQLAQAVGMTQTSISDLERGKSRATSFVAQIAGACGVNPLWLAEGRGEMLAER
ncbi:XRE family transcriptional regulator, partial [Pseudomonas aeruginosa]